MEDIVQKEWGSGQKRVEAPVVANVGCHICKEGLGEEHLFYGWNFSTHQGPPHLDVGLHIRSLSLHKEILTFVYTEKILKVLYLRYSWMTRWAFINEEDRKC